MKGKGCVYIGGGGGGGGAFFIQYRSSVKPQHEPSPLYRGYLRRRSAFSDRRLWKKDSVV